MPQPTQFHGRLAGRRVIVTGAGSLGDGVGTGRAIAALFAAEGATVALFDIDAGRAAGTLDLMRALGGGEGRIFAGDLSDHDACGRLVAESVGWLGGLDILVNNLGISAGAGPVDETSRAEFDRAMAANFGSMFSMSHHAIPHLRKGRSPAIVSIASIGGIQALGNAGYGPSKAAMIQLTAEMAVMYGKDGIRANVVLPGHIFTPMVSQTSVGERRRVRRDIAPLGIEGDAWDIAQAALFLAGPESRFVSGVALPVDGGVTRIAPLAAYAQLRGFGED